LLRSGIPKRLPPNNEEAKINLKYIIIIIIITKNKCKNKGDTSKNGGDWDYFKVIQKIREQHTRKT